LENENKPAILIVDDEAEIREYLRIILEDSGYRVIEADSGKAALSIAARQDPPLSLMITDVLMPHMHGKDLAMRVRSILPQLKILYMSGYALEILTDLKLCPDPAALMRKPLDVNATLATVKRFLKG
jgi:two-component system, cell cycle sensor histidine kinase and response regulator CckA